MGIASVTRLKTYNLIAPDSKLPDNTVTLATNSHSNTCSRNDYVTPFRFNRLLCSCTTNHNVDRAKGRICRCGQRSAKMKNHKAARSFAFTQEQYVAIKCPTQSKEAQMLHQPSPINATRQGNQSY